MIEGRWRPTTSPALASAPRSRGAVLAGRGVDVLHQGIDRNRTARRMRSVPPIRAKTSTNLAFDPVSDVPHRLVDNGRTRTFGDGVPRAQDPGRPDVVTSQNGSGRQEHQRVRKRVLVVE